YASRSNISLTFATQNDRSNPSRTSPIRCARLIRPPPPVRRTSYQHFPSTPLYGPTLVVRSWRSLGVSSVAAALRRHPEPPSRACCSRLVIPSETRDLLFAVF